MSHDNGKRFRRGLGWAAGLAGVTGVVLSSAYRRINAIEHFPSDRLRRLRDGQLPPLFQAHPALSDRIPWISLGSFPTPLERIAVGERPIWVKRDDLSSAVYGGNKVRKLEFLLAEATLLGRDRVITLGGLGSNHALATVIHAGALGMGADLVLYDQPITDGVRANFNAFLVAGATIRHSPSIAGAFAVAGAVRARRLLEGGKPYFVMVGGTSPLGCMGYVNAGIEFGRQVAEGQVPEPERIVVPLGTTGTVVGLLVGLRLAGLGSRVTAVQVADSFPANSVIVRYLAQNLARFLRSADPSVPPMSFSRADFDVLPDYFGQGYGRATAAGDSAVAAAAPALELDPTYTGKAMAACLDLVRDSPGEEILFWNTYNSAPLPRPGESAGPVGRDRVPRSLRRLIGAADAEPL